MSLNAKSYYRNYKLWPKENAGVLFYFEKSLVWKCDQGLNVKTFPRLLKPAAVGSSWETDASWNVTSSYWKLPRYQAY